MDERRLELKVGGLVLGALGALALLLVALGELGGGGGSRLFVDFAFAGGLPSGAPVKLAGVKVGRVTAVELHAARREANGGPLPVRVVVDLEPRALAGLRGDVRFSVATQGPLGEPYLEIDPGSTAAPPLAAGAELRGLDPARIDVLTSRIADLLDAAGAAIGDDPESFRALARELTSLAKESSGALRDNRPTLDRAAGDLAAAAADLRAVTAETRALLAPGGAGRRLVEDGADVAGQLKRDLPALSARADRALAGAEQLTGSVTPEDVAAAKAAIARYEAAGARFEEVAGRADRLLAKIERGEGSIGGLANDPVLYQDLKALLTDLRQHPWKLLWKGDERE